MNPKDMPAILEKLYKEKPEYKEIHQMHLLSHVRRNLFNDIKLACNFMYPKGALSVAHLPVGDDRVNLYLFLEHAKDAIEALEAKYEAELAKE